MYSALMLSTVNDNVYPFFKKVSRTYLFRRTFIPIANTSSVHTQRGQPGSLCRRWPSASIVFVFILGSGPIRARGGRVRPRPPHRPRPSRSGNTAPYIPPSLATQPRRPTPNFPGPVSAVVVVEEGGGGGERPEGAHPDRPPRRRSCPSGPAGGPER